jgi:hypothetical protein
VHDRVGLVHALDASGMEFGQVIELVGKLVGLFGLYVAGCAGKAAM